ncbi:hypothetical protein V8E54_004528 [Elaphomyces granulatus]
MFKSKYSQRDTPPGETPYTNLNFLSHFVWGVSSGGGLRYGCRMRPDIAIIIQTIQKNKVSTFIDLYFILRGAVDDNKRATPENIPKTIIFLDNINLIHDCAAKLQEWLVEMTKDCVDETERFTYAKAAVVQPY